MKCAWTSPNFIKYIAVTSLLLICVLWIVLGDNAELSPEEGATGYKIWSQEQIERKQQILKVCHEHRAVLYYPLAPVFDHLFAHIPEYNMFYCGVPKAGTSTWLYGTLLKLTATKDVEKFNQTHVDEFLENYQLQYRERLDRMLASDPLSFVNVRHPFERLVSGFNHLRNAPQIFPQLKGKTCGEYLRDVVLAEANASENKIKFEKMNQHWRPYNALCAFCSFNYTVISKTETFDQDEMRIMEMFGLTGRKQSKLGTSAGDKIQNITKQCFENITQEDRTALVDLYKYDFAMFGYDPQDYV